MNRYVVVIGPPPAAPLGSWATPSRTTHRADRWVRASNGVLTVLLGDQEVATYESGRWAQVSLVDADTIGAA